MLLPIFIICLSHLVLASPVQRQYDLEDLDQIKYHFDVFKVKHNKSYTAEEEILRFNYFKESIAKINELNKNNPLTVYGINKFSDLSDDEMRGFFGLAGASLGDSYGSCSTGVAADITNGSVAGAVDWRDKNAVAPVQNQGTCGSCWAFSAATILEGSYAIKHNTLLKVSEQQFVDCDTQSNGCEGGWMHNAITLNMQQGGQELQADYPYQDQQLQCRFDASRAKVTANSCKVFPNIGDSDDRLANLLASTGPLSIALNAEPFRHYQGGILNECSGAGGLNHGVSLIGYGDEGGSPYWIVKNSWGPDWGEGGFVRVRRGVGCILIGDYVLTADVA